MANFLPLVDERTYVDGWANRHTVMGPCRDYPDWCWTNTGNWFDRATGIFIHYDPKTGTHRPGTVSWRDLWKEAGHD
jgi:hypothetical protein